MVIDLNNIWLSKPRLVLGIMTGTSLDGIDLCLAEFKSKSEYKVLAEFSSKFSSKYSEIVLSGINSSNSASFYSTLNVLYSDEILTSINLFKAEYPKLFNLTDAIAIHGQTIWHNPAGTKINGKIYKSTWQLCDPSYLAKHSGKIVVSDFRSADIALGGQAAPLIPIFDLNFLSDASIDTICLNIGGMSNLTYLPANNSINDYKKDILAFDTGPGNVLIDLAANEIFDKKYDNNGDLARKGSVNQKLFDFLNSIEFIHQAPPKSTGRELFDQILFNHLINIKNNNSIPDSDFISTLTYFSAYSIAINIKNNATSNCKIIVSGGGSKNSFLMDCLKRELPKSEIVDSDLLGISSEYKESLAFAYIAWRTLAGLPSNLPSVTGSSKAVTLGSLTFP